MSEEHCVYRVNAQTRLLPDEREALPAGRIPREGLCSVSDPRFQLCTHPMASIEDCPEARSDWCDKPWTK